jgi:hypothetical protein
VPSPLEEPSPLEAIGKVAWGVFEIGMGAAEVFESGGLLFYAGEAEVAHGAYEVTEGIVILCTAPGSAPGVDYGAAPDATTTITLPTIEITGQVGEGPTVITRPEIVIYGDPPPGVTVVNVITLPTIDLNELPDNPPTSSGGEDEEEGGGE